MSQPITTILTTVKATKPKTKIELYDLVQNIKGMHSAKYDGGTTTTTLYLASGQTIYVKETPQKIKELIGWESNSDEKLKLIPFNPLTSMGQLGKLPHLQTDVVVKKHSTMCECQKPVPKKAAVGNKILCVLCGKFIKQSTGK